MKKSELQPVSGDRTLWEIAGVFFKLGCLGFGGPAVHIAMMEEEVVRKRKWISADHFLDLIGATNLIPGPNSTEMTMHCGHERGGWKGLIVAGMCFIFPAVIITAIIAWAYQRYGALPEVQPFIYGIKPAIIAIIVALMISLGRKALKSTTLAVIGALALLLALIGINEIIVLFGAGAVGVLAHLLTKRSLILSLALPTMLIADATQLSPMKLFWIFLEIGSILYGSGYVLFAFLEAELVAKDLLSRPELIDAIAVGQFTPGPVFSAATFIGWQVGGWQGAIAATVGIFLPSFLFVAFLNPLIPRLRKSPVMSAFLDTINVASVAVIIAVAVDMGRETFLDWRTVVIAVAGFLVSFYFRKLNSAFLVVGGAILGYILWWI